MHLGCEAGSRKVQNQTEHSTPLKQIQQAAAVGVLLLSQMLERAWSGANKIRQVNSLKEKNTASCSFVEALWVSVPEGVFLHDVATSFSPSWVEETCGRLPVPVGTFCFLGSIYVVEAEPQP